jgi:catechol 2,3-dioxygenase-like lactoylglutathione lyase family enzyme
MDDRTKKTGRRDFLAAAGAALAAPLLGAGRLAGKEATVSPAPQAESGPGPLPFGEVSHLGWVVRDVRKAAGYWQKIGALDGASIEDSHRISGVFRGNSFDISLPWAWSSIGGVGLEIFQPREGDAVYWEFLKRHGEGIQHVAFSQESPEILEKRVSAMAAKGIGVVQRGTFREGKGIFVYLDTAPVGGLDIELVYDPVSAGRKKSGTAPAAAAGRYPFDKIVQYALTVRDVDRVAELYGKMGFPIRSIDRDNRGLQRRYRGEPEDFLMHMGWSSFGSVTLEIIQPTRGRSIYGEYLERHGDGFHHLAFNVRDMDEAVAAFDKLGVKVSQDGAWGSKDRVDGRFAYLDTEPEGGLTIELLWDKK